jgi:hypothetical protein
VILAAVADSWIDQNSASNNFGSDSILKIRSQGPGDNFRILLQFTLPAGTPAGCEVESAYLGLYSPSAAPDRVLHVLQLVGDWSEDTVTWANQPATIPVPAATDSGTGYLEWNVTSMVQLMYSGSNNGFMIRDASEGGGGFEEQFHSREKGESMPQLVITFGTAP